MIEILSPAGGEECAYAAVNAGTDAIYLGLDRFSARSSAENFDDEKFLKITKYARAFGVKVYVALNTVVKDCELENFLNSVVSVWNGGADAIILQDLFLGKFIKQSAPQIKLHLSTQAGTCNALGAQLAKDSGFDRVILARETKLKDIEKISKIIQTETFIQGALCTCFSGQCYMSSFAGGNSGNRGKCKQPCRKLYSIDRSGFEEQAYRLSLSDLSVGENIHSLIDAGVSSFKIEGRMRRPEYVAAAVNYYKSILSGKDGDISALKRTYNRGNYTNGLAFGQDKSFISSAVQGHIGEFVGIIKVENTKYILQTNQKFSNGDGFKILRGGKEVGGGSCGGECKGGYLVNTRTRLKNGDKVFITTDVALNEKLLQTKRLIPVKISAEFLAGNRAKITVDGEEFLGDGALERANSRPLLKEEIIRNFQKTDGYPFSPEFTDIKTDGVFITAANLNALRRSVYEKTYARLTENKNEQVFPEFVLPEITNALNGKTAIIATNLSGVNADIGILKSDDYSQDCSSLLNGFEGEKFLFVPPYMTGEEVEKIIGIAEQFDGIYCDGYFGFELAKKLNKPFFAGVGLNIANSVSLAGVEAKYTCLSKELTIAEADALSQNNVFYLSGGNIKVMDLIYCPFEKKCSTCDKRKTYTLTDGEGREFPLRRYVTGECRFEVYNCADLVTNGAKCGKIYDLTLPQKNANRTRGHSVNGIY
ncbi:MAG: U32 family peptidase [Clostridia bacterium]|nr:U32 family peptidase [Clostridia bacterium]